MKSDQEFLEYVVKAIVDHPEEVKIKRTVNDKDVLINLEVHPEDMGKIIGRKGNTADSIRTILRVVGMKNNERIKFKVDEPSSAHDVPFEKEDSEY